MALTQIPTTMLSDSQPSGYGYGAIVGCIQWNYASNLATNSTAFVDIPNTGMITGKALGYARLLPMSTGFKLRINNPKIGVYCVSLYSNGYTEIAAGLPFLYFRIQETVGGTSSEAYGMKQEQNASGAQCYDSVCVSHVVEQLTVVPYIEFNAQMIVSPAISCLLFGGYVSTMIVRFIPYPGPQ